MANQKIVEYISQLQAASIPNGEIIQKLKEAGWPQELIDEAFASIGGAQVPDVVVPPVFFEQSPREIQKKNSSSKLIAFSLLIFVLGIAVVAGAVWGYGYYFPSPEVVMANMTKKMAAVNTSEYQGKIGFEVSYESGSKTVSWSGKDQKISFDIDFDGVTDTTDAKKQETAINFKLSNKEYLQGDINLNMVTVGELLYAKIGGNAKFFEYGQFNPYLNQWLEFDYKKIIEKVSETNPEFADYYKKNVKTGQLTPVQIANLESLAKKTKIMIVDKQLSDETVNGVACRHYQTKINKDGLKSYIKGMGDIMQDRISQTQVGQMVDFINAANFSNYEIWIAKNDFSLRRVKGAMDYKYEYFGLASYLLHIDFDMNYKSINQPVKIEAPEKSKSVVDLFEESMVSARGKARDARRQSDMRQLISAQEMYYGDKDRYYTCGVTGGDCKGKPNNYPGEIGTYINPTPVDPMGTGTICGQDNIYCGLDNAKKSDQFCYYAKLEDGTFFTSSSEGNFKRNIAPKSFAECGASDIQTKSETAGVTVQSRDAYRMSAMRQLVSAQEMYYGDKENYYTCGKAGGDCKGKPNNYPVAIPAYMTNMPKDPVGNGNVCGTDYIFCGLDNSKNKDKFCFYAKLESGGFYTASHNGNFKKTAVPKNLDDCAKE